MSEMCRGKCAVCGDYAIQYFPVDVNDWSPSIVPGMEEEQLLNLGFDYSAMQINNAMLSHVSFCKHCGYCSADIFKETLVEKEDVESPKYRSILYRDGISLHTMHFLALVLASECHDAISMAYHTIIMEWNKTSSRSGVNMLTPAQCQVLQEGMYLMSKGVLMSLADIFRCRQNRQMAEMLLDAIEDRDLDEAEIKIVEYQRYLLSSCDHGPHNVSEAYVFADECKEGGIDG